MNEYTPIRKIIDDRGWLAELIQARLFGEIRHVYVTTCLPGVVKAWHMHEKQTDRFVLLRGRLLVGLDNGVVKKSIVLMPFSGVLTIHPGVWHGFSAIGNREAVVLNCTDKDYDPSDEFRRPPSEGGFCWESISR